MNVGRQHQSISAVANDRDCSTRFSVSRQPALFKVINQVVSCLPDRIAGALQRSVGGARVDIDGHAGEYVELILSQVRDVHIPGLRHCCFEQVLHPRIEGYTLENDSRAVF